MEKILRIFVSCSKLEQKHKKQENKQPGIKITYSLKRKITTTQ